MTAFAPSKLADIWNDAWQRLRRGVVDHKAATRHPVLATIGLDGFAEARTVVLRACDPVAASLSVYTDARSHKINELHAHPGATLLFWDPRARLQIRARVRMAIATGEALTDLWASLPEGARAVYGGDPAPGRPIDGPDAHEPKPDPAQFARLDGSVISLEALHLIEPKHLRARFERADGFQGQWLAP
ncbi:MAG: pyridoxamine 5'-phosphate oxidase family protein [Geminicoccaceae bacterium]